MDKNQAIIGLIIMVLVVVCIFLYFVFKPQSSEEMVNMEGEDVSYTFDVDMQELEGSDEIAAIMGEQGDDVATTEGLAQSNDSKPYPINSQEAVNNKKQNTSPETGPGEIALVIATIIGVASAFIVHKKISKNQ